MIHFAVGFTFVPNKGAPRSGNVFMWVSLFTGTGLLMCLYCMEWFARQRCPRYTVSYLVLSSCFAQGQTATVTVNMLYYNHDIEALVLPVENSFMYHAPRLWNSLPQEQSRAANSPDLPDQKYHIFPINFQHSGLKYNLPVSIFSSLI